MLCPPATLVVSGVFGDQLDLPTPAPIIRNLPDVQYLAGQLDQLPINNQQFKQAFLVASLLIASFEMLSDLVVRLISSATSACRCCCRLVSKLKRAVVADGMVSFAMN